VRLSAADQARKEKLTFVKFLATHPSFKQCPSPNCGLVFEASSSATSFTCRSCAAVYCSRCLQVHGELTCLEHQYYEHLNASAEGEMLQTARSSKYKKCPRCRYWVEKSDGWDHMRCRCEFEFCYKCRGVYNRCACRGYDNAAELASVVQF
jgi:ariadne-1